MLDDVILEESREHQLQDDYRSASINGKHGYPGDVSGQGRSKTELFEKVVIRPET